ncbi:hypothetical protein [uncultured Apibacter sp.]|uniref:hypothetical protein n=1 Tax=uncultured Apibacter sp. TaxID=1778616 RepID=UPI0025D4B90A|nr:hypothetical protein [uncultured Apibacter sp.]
MKKIFYYIVFIYLLIIISSISCCIKKDSFNPKKQTILFSPSLNDTIKQLVLYNYPKKWSFYLDETPAYNSVKDSLTDEVFMNLLSIGSYSTLNQSFNILSDSMIKDTIKKTILYDYPKISLYVDEVINDSLKASSFAHEMKKIMWNEENIHTITFGSKLKNFNDSELNKIFYKELPKFHMSFNWKWDVPYFIGVLYEKEDYILNIYRNGYSYEKCYKRDKYLCDFYVVNYILLEVVNKKTKEKKYFISNIDTNCKYQSFNRIYYLDILKDSLTIIDFYWDEIDRYFLERKEYNLN